MKKIIFRRKPVGIFYIYRTEESCDNIELEGKQFADAHPDWDVLVMEDNYYMDTNFLRSEPE
jgi:hypothetical protein